MVYVHGNLYDLTLVNTVVAYFTDFHNKLTEAVSWAALQKGWTRHYKSKNVKVHS